MKTIKYIITLTLILITNKNWGQNVSTLYSLDVVPQQGLYNPAFMPKNSTGYINFISIPSLDLEIGHSGFISPRNGLKLDGSSLIIDLDKVEDKMPEQNHLYFNENVQLYGLGFKIEDLWYFDLNLNTRSGINWYLPKGLFVLIEQDNTNSIGEKPVTIEDFGMHLFGYAEFAIGVTRTINDKLTIGIRPKILMGGVDISFSSDLAIVSAPSIRSINSNAEATTTIDSEFTGGNKGFAIDLGGVYKINDEITVSASLLDLGSIKWTTNPSLYEPSLQVTISPKENEIFDFETNLDSLLEDDAGSPIESYTTNLPAQFFLNGTYKLNDKTTVGLLMKGRTVNKRTSTSYTTSLNYEVGRHLSTSVSWSIRNATLDNLGIGVATTFAPFQFYVATDNILGPFKVANENYNVHNANIHFGTNWLFGGRSHKKEAKHDQKMAQKIENSKLTIDQVLAKRERFKKDLLFANQGETDKTAKKNAKLIKRIRKQNVQTEFYPKNATLKEQIEYAKRKNILFIAHLKSNIEEDTTTTETSSDTHTDTVKSNIVLQNETDTIENDMHHSQVPKFKFNPQGERVIVLNNIDTDEKTELIETEFKKQIKNIVKEEKKRKKTEKQSKTEEIEETEETENWENIKE